MQPNKININKILVTIILCSSLYAEIAIIAGVNYGGVTYSEEIYQYMSIANGIGFNAALEKSIGPTIVGLGFFQQSYIENFDYSTSESDEISFTFKNTTSTNYAMGYVIYPYEIDPLRVWGGLQFGHCLSGTSTLKYNGQETKRDIKSDEYNLDYGLLLGVDYMFMKYIGVRGSYYYGLAEVFKEEIDFFIANEEKLNAMNVGINAQLLLRF